jgi:hypothetical protein
MRRVLALVPTLVLLTALAFATTADAGAAARGRGSFLTTIRFDGIGPLRIGMTRDEVRATGWFRSTSTSYTCFTNPLPLPTFASPDGPRAAPGATLTAYFRGGDGTLTHIMFANGARTALGIRPGLSTGLQMVAAYRRAGFTVRTSFHSEYNGTFVDVVRRGRVVMTGLAPRRLGDRIPLMTVAIPTYFTC